ncbi:serine/threonine-protein kinase [Streptomyces sp. NPDC059272]|uniref:serine/threonine-protein kinase n=1 Tax=Streptomyces sp. NPDC059272 TaxID=3346800 RepID=UPI003684A3E7
MSEAERAGTSRQDTRRDKNERLLAGRYRLGEVLGRGGMGTVWRAEDETLGRTVAVKELRFPTSIDEDEKRRLITRTLREAKAIARIRNTSAVTVYDVVDEDDRPWIVMELVEGKSLAEAIREDGLLKPRRAAEVGLAILDVLRSAHREGILHRDVKPSNVLIAEDGRVVLTDFGIAQVEGDPSITSTGMLVGAPSYISPERARGHKPGPAADLWSLGGLLYAAVEGAPPYDKGSAIATLTAVMTEPLEEPKNAGPLKDVIYGLLNKDPAQRLDDAGARAMLTAVIHAPEPKPAEPEPPLDATRVVPLPAQPGPAESGGKKGGSGGSGASAGAERLRGALRSMRKAAGGSAAAAAGASAAAGSATGSGARPATGAGAAPSGEVSRGASGTTTGGATRTGSDAATGGASRTGSGAATGSASGGTTGAASGGASPSVPGKPGGSGPGAGAGTGAAAAGAGASGKSGTGSAKGAAAEGSSGTAGAKSGTSGVPSARSGGGAGAATRSGTSAGAGTAAGAGAAAASAAKGGATDSGSRDAGSRDSGVQSLGLREQGLGDTGTKGLSATREVGARGDKSAARGRSSGWPVMTPPDLPPRPAPRAPLTDVVPKRTLVIIAVVAALAVIGVVLALTLGGGDGSGSKGSKDSSGAKAGGGVSASASASADEKKDDDDTKSSGGAQTDSSATASAGQNTASSGTGASSGSDGGTTGSSDGAPVVKTYRSSQGFSIGLPAGWSYQSTDSAGVRLAGPDGQKLLIAWTSTPKSDAVADWKNQEQYMTRSGYSRIRIEKVDYRGWNTADWEFTYQDGGTKYRTIDRGFVVNSHLGYALMYTAKSANWGTELRKDTWTTLTKTFQPKS